MIRGLSASKLQRVVACPASAVLPRVETTERSPWSSRGTAIHVYVATVGSLGREAALANVPEEFREECAALEIDRLPVDPKAWAHELALAYNVETQTARELGRGAGDRPYESIGPNEIPGTIDIAGIDADCAVVIDTKTGWVDVPVVDNWQLVFGALAMCAAFGTSRAKLGILTIRNGRSWIEWTELDAFELDAAADTLRTAYRRVVDERERFERTGTVSKAVIGDHCRYCPCEVFCPAKTALVREIGLDPAMVSREIPTAELTPETAALAFKRLRQIEDVLKSVKAQLYAYAAEHPVPLGRGKVLGQVRVKREVLDGRKTFDILREVYGDDVAQAAVDMETSKAAIERALKPVVVSRKEAGEKIALSGKTGLLPQTLEQLRQRGAVEVKWTTSVGERDAENEPAELEAGAA